MKHNIVIIGAGYAGIIAALRVAGKTRSMSLHITLVNADSEFKERIRFHQIVSGNYRTRHKITSLLGKREIEFIHGLVKEINPGTREVVVALTDGHLRLAYDTLVYALGSTIGTSQIVGLDDYTYQLASSGKNTLTALAERLPSAANNQQHLLVIGGGLTGIESATEIAEAYPNLSVTLATRGTIGEGLSDSARSHIRNALKRLHIDLIEHTNIVCVEPDHVQIADRSRLHFDLCLWSGSFVVSSLARESGLEVDTSGRIIVDSTLRSISHPSIIAIGDAASLRDNPLRMACSTAMPLAAHAADNIVKSLQKKTEVPFRFKYVIQCISLGRSDAVIQFVDENDHPTKHILTGIIGAWVKEWVNRYTVWSIHLERWWPGSYRIPKSDH